jgi:hypothetical protein
MRYPTLNPGRTDDLVGQQIQGLDVVVDNYSTWRGDGESIDFEPLDDILDGLKEDLGKLGIEPTLTSDKDPFEGKVAIATFPFLASLPPEVLDDPGFWRYLAAGRFWWFVQWREAVPIASGRVGTYTSANRNTEQIPLRLFLRAKSISGGSDLSLAGALTKSTDFWRSHVIRVRTGTAPPVARSFAEMQANELTHLSTEPLRAYARRLNRTWTNVNLNLLDGDEAAALISELRD